MLYDWIRHMSFAYKWVFPFFGVLPLMVWWYVKQYNRTVATIKVSSANAFQVSSVRLFFRHFPFVFRLLAIAALIVALARPQTRNDQEHLQGEGIDIVLCMDVSGSMGSRDIAPSRMEVAKEVAVNFVMGRPVDRIGLVVFSGESFTQCPITTDRNTLIHQIQTLESRRFLKDGTVIGEGLATAVDRLSKSTAPSKVIILITDGKEDPPDTRLIDPLTALEIAKAHGVRVHTIGMGALPSTVVENTGNATQGKNAAIDFIDESLLRKIAEETGGRYFRAKDKEGLQNIYKEIDKMEKSKIDVTSYKRYQELFIPFVLTALALLFLDVLLRTTLLRKFP